MNAPVIVVHPRDISPEEAAFARHICLRVAALQAEYDALVKERRPFWIGGVPTAGDKRGLLRDLARRNGMSPKGAASMLLNPL